MQNLTVKNVVLAAVALYVFSVIAPPPATFTSVMAVRSTNNPVPAAGIKAAHEEMSKPRQKPVVKILDLPDSETLRLNDTTFVDLGWRQTADKDGEWVGHIGSDTEYLPLSAEQIAGMLKEAQMKALPPPPIRRVATTRPPINDGPRPLAGFEPVDSEALLLNDTAIVDTGSRQTAEQNGERPSQIGSDAEFLQLSGNHIAGLLKEAHAEALPSPPIPPVATAPSPQKDAARPPKGIDLFGWIPILLCFAFMMYVRYRIAQMTVDAAQGAAGKVKRALADLLTPKKNETKTQPSSTQVVAARAPAPIAVSIQYKKPAGRGTVVRPGSGLFGFLKGAR